MPHIRNTIARLAVAGSVLLPGIVMSQPSERTLTIGSDAIVSLANAPALREASGRVDEAGRPALDLQLTFANDCLRDTGADIRYADPGGEGPAVILVRQALAPDGCPDIFRPVDASLRVLLPPSLAGRAVLLVARPVSGNTLPRIDLEAGGEASRAENVVEARPFAPGTIMPAAGSLDANASNPGYRVTGRLSVDPECLPDRVQTALFELPDDDGEPRRDVLLITAAENCRASGEPVDVTIAVASPQNAPGRAVFVPNSGSPDAIPIEG
jgi:hypothetical protein